MIRVTIGIAIGALLATLYITRGPMHQIVRELQWCRGDLVKLTPRYIPPADFSRKLH